MRPVRKHPDIFAYFTLESRSISKGCYFLQPKEYSQAPLKDHRDCRTFIAIPLHTMPHILRDVVILNNDCVQEMLQVPNEPERLLNAFRTLQHALRMLRNDASVAEMNVKVQRSTGSGIEESSSSSLHSASHSHRSEYILNSALLPSVQNFSFPSYSAEFEPNPSTDVYYVYDRPLLFHQTYTRSHGNDYDDNDLDTMNFVCATVLFNLALICHRYAMTQSDHTRSDLLLNARKLYNVLIELLSEIVTAKTESSLTQPMNTTFESDDEEVEKAVDIILLLTLTYHCLGHLNFELGMIAESSDCMMKLHYVIVSQPDVFECIRSSHFDHIIDEIKLNIVFWKMYAPSPVAIAA